MYYCTKCYQAGCEDGDCMETIIVKKVYAYEVPKYKYKQLLENLKVKKLINLEQYSDDFNRAIDTLEEIMTERTTEEIEIDDGEY